MTATTRCAPPHVAGDGIRGRRRSRCPSVPFRRRRTGSRRCGEAGDPPKVRSVGKAVPASGEDLVGVAWCPRPDDPVRRAVEDVVQGDGELPPRPGSRRVPPVRARCGRSSPGAAPRPPGASPGNLLQVRGDSISTKRGISAPLRPPGCTIRTFPQRLALGPKRARLQSFPPELPGAGHRGFHAERHGVGPFPPCAVLRVPYHLLEVPVSSRISSVTGRGFPAASEVAQRLHEVASPPPRIPAHPGAGRDQGGGFGAGSLDLRQRGNPGKR